MIIDDTIAWNEMCARVRERTALPAVVSFIGYEPDIYYPDIKPTRAPPNDKIRLHILKHSAGVKKRTLGLPARVTHHGIVEVEIYVPVGDTRAPEIVLKLAAALKGGFAFSTPNVEFFGAFIRDVPRDAQWIMRRVQATYTYDTR